ncbi:MAG: ROK family transcriptional regulator [Spirochaetales bacterium]|nr:ROK family transcriptional regulator [Spirochaetales bacterium]
MRTKARGSNLPRIKIANQFLIREMVYRKGPISRIEVAEELGLTLPTITTNVSMMIDRGLIREVPSPVRTKSLGRHTMLVEMVPESRRYLGVEIRGTLRRAVLADLKGNVIASASDDTMYPDYDKALENAVVLSRSILAQKGMGPNDVDAIGLCTPGLVDPHEGLLVIHPGYQWEQKRIGDDFAASLGFKGHVYIENNAIARAFALSLFNPGKLKDASSFAYMYVSTGIACPLLNDAKKHFGVVAGEGEVGHMVMNPDGPVCACGNHGCLETYSSEATILEKAGKAIGNGKAPVLASLTGPDGNPTMEQIMEAQKQGDADVNEIIVEAVRYLGLAIANIDNFVKPECVAIECRLFDNLDNRELLMKEINRNLYRKTYNDFRFTFMKGDELSGACGAAAVAIKNDLENYIE